MPRAIAGFDDAQCRERAEIAVEVAAARHRVDVRSEQDGRQRRLAAGAASEDVAGRIDARLEAGRAHQVHHVLAARDVGVGKRHTAHAVGEHAAGRTAEDAQRFDALAEYGGVRAQVLH